MSMQQELQAQIETIVQEQGRKLTKELLYRTIMEFVLKKSNACKMIESEKKLYYISAEFLIGKMLASNLINLGLYDDVSKIVEANGFLMQDILDLEKEPSLGNGGLGRLAACFLDSIATLNLPGDGIGLYYHCGLFQQQFQALKQEEVANHWMEEPSWFVKKQVSFRVSFPHITLHPVLYGMLVLGYHGGYNTLHLFDIESVDETILGEGITFDKKDIARNLTLFLYPDDSDEDGRLLRIYQQYFMVSCGAQMIIADCKEKGYSLYDLHKHVVIQINDTHPTLVIPELIRLLMEEGMLFKEALAIIEKTCAYTNHTILAEALETWPMEYLEKVVPNLMPIIQALDVIAQQRSKLEKLQIIDQNKLVHMAHIDLHFGMSVNGVAAIHTQILKESELHDFYNMYPDKFNNKTNGITFRRWLYSCNLELTNWMKTHIGEGFLNDAMQLEKLEGLLDNEQALQALLDIKQLKKRQWITHMRVKQGIYLDENAIFDTQVKRLHEYKRQQMNALYIIYKYKQIKEGNLPIRPITCIFGAKAAPAYTIAKDIIHVLLCLEKIIREDAEVSPHLQLCFIENYNISEAEFVIPASDVSEQISLASKEASGTGNMKFMLNGALTLGTRDGANVEIADYVKDENIYIFGENSEQVMEHYALGDYRAKDLYEQEDDIKVLVDFLVGEEMLAVGDATSLTRLYDELLNKDWFMTLLDVLDYIQTKEKMFADYEDRLSWSKKMLINIARSGFFSSDRTIKEYEQDIWHLTKKEEKIT